MPLIGNGKWSIPEGRTGEAIGIVAGIVFGILYLIVGFWRTIAFGIFVIIGATIGRYFDTNDGAVQDVVRKWRHPRNY